MSSFSGVNCPLVEELEDSSLPTIPLHPSSPLPPPLLPPLPDSLLVLDLESVVELEAVVVDSLSD